MVLEKIRNCYPQLTKSQKRLADYVVASYREAAFMTASRLADHLGLNEATVIRFTQRLGYAGYPQFSEDVQSIVRQELVPDYGSGDAADLRAPLLHVLDNEVQALRYTTRHISADVARQAQALLGEARRVIVLGQGVSAPLAQLLAVCLRSIGVAAEAPPADYANATLSLAFLNGGCAVVGVAALADSLEVAGALRYAGEAGARTLALAWSPISAVAQAAEVALTCPMGDLLPVPSVAGTAVLIDALMQSLGADDSERMRTHAEKVAQVRDHILARRRR